VTATLDLAAIVQQHGGDPTRLVQILHDVTAAAGYVPPAAITELAARLGVPRAATSRAWSGSTASSRRAASAAIACSSATTSPIAWPAARRCASACSTRSGVELG
jgi:hypothetical protein